MKGKFIYYLRNYLRINGMRAFDAIVDDAVVGIAIHIGGGYFDPISTAIFKEDGLILNPSLTSAFVSWF